ncbi:CLUMA_CG017598, isoform A [Clunio marinus]|uniref:CLUMA_CG017598, isoform A n=1 Tax=Clunio marinus TaxID=568069 RepID=A0A1J1IW68_9DIPT|nr:CLUMA_CG017598, isoform A [Clunio marinus]
MPVIDDGNCEQRSIRLRAFIHVRRKRISSGSKVFLKTVVCLLKIITKSEAKRGLAMQIWVN